MKQGARPVRSLLAIVGLLVIIALPLSIGPAQGTNSSARAGSCAGFTNRIGMTNKLIRIGNASDVSGPVPGLYTGAQLATKAYVAYFNSARRICGRKLALDSYDTRTDTTTSTNVYASICTRDFATVGSISWADAGGAAKAQGCRLPDLRATSLSPARNSCTTCFGVEASRAGEAPNSVPNYFLAHHNAAVQKAAMLYLNTTPWVASAATQQAVAQSRGYTFVYTRAIDLADFNYGPYVQQLINLGVRAVQFVGPYQQAVRLAQAMEQAGYKPEVFLVDRSAYDPAYLSSGGASVEGSITAINSLPLNANQAELNLYRTWLKKVAPTAVPTVAGLYAWSAAKLFTSEAIILGAKLTRASLVARLKTVTGWTGGGLHAPMAVGTKHVSPCTRLLLLHNGHWVSIGGTAYTCSGISTDG